MPAEPFIGRFRRQLADLLRVEGSLPVYSYLPDDVAHLPVYVIGRPSTTESATPAVMTQTLDVFVLGRRVSDEDSQAELDAYADECFDVLGGTRGTKIGDRQGIRCTGVLAGSVIVAGAEIPCYSLSVATDILTC